MGIVAIFLVVLVNIFLSVLEVQLESQSASSVDIDGRFILSRLAYDIHRAQNFSITPTSLSLTINGLNFSYALNGDDLELITPNGSYQLNSHSSQVSDLLFTRVGNNTGKDTVQITFITTSGKQTRDYQTTIGLR